MSVGILEREELKILKSLDFNLCLQCGKCAASCPMFTRTKLNPRTLVRKTLYFVSQSKTYPPLDISKLDDIWDCTTCSNCVIYCPRDVKPMDIILAFRSILIERGNVPLTIAEALENIYKFGNPFGISSLKRAEWTKNLDIKKISEGSKSDLLYFVGCITSYDNRAQNIARSMAITLKSLGIDFEIVPNLHINDGINAVRMRFNTLWIDEKRCAKFLKAIALYRKEWNEKMGEFKPKPLHDWTSHAADMLRYLSLIHI